jgi:hypothetical protein
MNVGLTGLSAVKGEDHVQSQCRACRVFVPPTWYRKLISSGSVIDRRGQGVGDLGINPVALARRHFPVRFLITFCSCGGVRRGSIRSAFA